MRLSAGLALGLAVLGAGGCEQGRPPEDVKHIKVENPYHDRLMRLSPPYQRLGVMRAIRDNGKRCRRVEGAAYQQEHQGLEMWVALCDDGRYWGVFIGPNGDTQVRDCQQMRQLELPQCRPVTVPPRSSEPF